MKKLKLKKETILLIPIMILSAILNIWNLGIEGYANQYYAAGVKSMTLSFKNFFFVSFDPAGFVTIDKPPLGFWIQAIFAKIFGFSGWSILLPQAIAGVISVAIIYQIVKRSFGNAAALISALCLATTPIFVAVSRNNTIDNLLVLALLLACWALSVAAEKGKLKYLIISMVLVGIGFNIKMLEAYMVAPALYITYLLSNAVSIKKRIVHLVIGTVILFLVSFSWAIVVDLIPKSDRPFVGSSTNDKVMELIFGHNGIERLSNDNSGTGKGRNPGKDGQFQGMPVGPGGQNSSQNQGMPPSPPNTGNVQSKTDTSASASVSKNAPPQNNNQQNMGKDNFNKNDGQHAMPPVGNGSNAKRPNGGRQGGSFGGTEKASITRLFSNNSLSDQIIWLFPLAVFGFIAAAIKEKLKYPFDNKKKQALILWSMWLVPVFIYFSYTKGLFHPYYLTMMSPPIAALSGIGIVSMWKLYKEEGWKSYILPAALIVTGALQLLILSYYYNISHVTKALSIVLSVLIFLSAAILILLKVVKSKNIKVVNLTVALALIGTLITPTYWSFTTLSYAAQGAFPSAGVELKTSNKMGNPMMGNSKNSSSNKKLVEFLKKNITTEKYSLVVSSANGSASSLIINYGEPVMALGGFSGSDKILTLNEFKQMVKKGEIRYVLVGGMGNGSNDIMNWVKENGKIVSDSEWRESTSSDIPSEDNNKVNYSNKENKSEDNKYFDIQQFGGNSEQLYDLKAYTNNLIK